jgi:non-canonical poly(A) RNA polymerase PAPD5/7
VLFRTQLSILLDLSRPSCISRLGAPSHHLISRPLIRTLFCRDIDLVILSKVMANSRKDNTLHHLANTVKRAGLTSKVSIIAKAKVPIIKFITTQEYGRFNVDMSVNQRNGIAAAGVVNGFLKNWSQDENGGKALRGLIMITKSFLAQRGMNEVFTGGLGSYAIVCLAISFLQLHPKIRRGEIDPEQNLGVLLMDFFELYGWYFNYEKTGISIRDGGRYFGKVERGWAEFDRRGQGLLSVEDPLDQCESVLFRIFFARR